jgi:vacuolar-type H+-ATPase subunit H
MYKSAVLDKWHLLYVVMPVNNGLLIVDYQEVQGMSVDILKDIRAAETQAEQIEAEASQKAREIIAAARRDAADLKTRLLEEAENEAGNVLKASEEKARQDIMEADARIQARCDDIRKEAGDRLDKAVDFIVGRIVKP